MHGQTRGGARRYYRCAAHARHPGITDAHPRDVLVREQPIVDALEEWLDELFAPEHATQTAREIAAALAHGPDRTEHIDTARRRGATAKREVERRAVLRDTNSPAARREVLTWLDQAAGEKEQAELALTVAMQLAPPSLSIEEIVAVVERCGGLTGILHQATDVERAAPYEAIGVSAVYNPERNQVRLGADPVASTACRRGCRRGDSHHTHIPDPRRVPNRMTPSGRCALPHSAPPGDGLSDGRSRCDRTSVR
jgi:hypothetical protein